MSEISLPFSNHAAMTATPVKRTNLIIKGDGGWCTVVPVHGIKLQLSRFSQSYFSLSITDYVAFENLHFDFSVISVKIGRC